MRFPSAVLITAFALTACSQSVSLPVDDLPDLPGGAQAISLLGDTLHPAAPNEMAVEQLEAALADYEANPDDADAIIWYGRRTAYTGQYREAIRI